jgi:hypothetical protein
MKIPKQYIIYTARRKWWAFWLNKEQLWISDTLDHINRKPFLGYGKLFTLLQTSNKDHAEIFEKGRHKYKNRLKRFLRGT